MISPDASLTIADDVLHMHKLAPPRQHRWPINTFFTSLAEDAGDCAACIVLSGTGTGSDGASGLCALKELPATEPIDAAILDCASGYGCAGLSERHRDAMVLHKLTA